ncbi:hypothetical protein [Massilia sp. GCM10023247]|uniref:hypothetical protein n=1 Tax=Massilia sp. GCM10023247 TaxID=3252643 RepID=UPI0036124B75
MQAEMAIADTAATTGCGNDGAIHAAIWATRCGSSTVSGKTAIEDSTHCFQRLGWRRPVGGVNQNCAS